MHCVSCSLQPLHSEGVPAVSQFGVVTTAGEELFTGMFSVIIA